jgi:hypothetical protein
MVCFVLFGEFDLLRRPDSTGFNRVGYLSKRGVVVYDRWRTVRQVPFEQIRKRPHIIKESTNSFDDTKIETFFLDNHPSIDLFRQGCEAILQNVPEFFVFPVKLPILSPISASERERRWSTLLSVLQSGDLITTFDTRSRMSRLISLLDSSPWSHIGTYAGEGRIVEALTSGVVERGIDAYDSARYRVGVYRYNSLRPDLAARLGDISRSLVGDGYSYFSAFVIGLRLLFRIKAGHERFLSIGQFLRLADIRLIHVV